MLSLGMLPARAFSSAYLSFRLWSGSGPPWRTADMIPRASLLNCRERFLSTAPLRAAMFAEWEWPAMGEPFWHELALAELEAAPGAATAVLLALLHAAVPREEAVRAQHVVVTGVQLLERAGDAEEHRVRLPRRAPAVHGDRDVVGLRRLRDDERLPDALLRLQSAEELVDRAVVDE